MSIKAYIRQQLADLVRLGRITAVDDSDPIQKVTVNVRVGMIDTNVARIQNYGFRSRPDASGELLGVEITCNGNRFVVALDDLNSPHGHEPGEVMMWHKNGDFIHMKNGNAIDVQTQTYTLNCETQIINATTTYLNCDVVQNGDSTITGNTDQTGNTTIIGDTSQTGSISATIDVSAGGKSGKTHTHNHGHSHPSGATDPLATDEPN